jgi:tRNA pseudouridine13 synthase
VDLPFLTADLPGVGGTLKDRAEDFVVEEIPLYPALGVGDHAYALVEKVGIPTREAIRRMAAALSIPESRVGCAGLKDARAVARQTLSFERVPPESLERLSLPGVRVLSVTRHRNKLRPGHLAGNRFEVRLRGVAPEAEARTAAVLEVLLRRGLPNWFGPQRFGTRGDTHLVGRALVRGDFAGAVALMCGRPSPRERDPRVLEARRRFDAGDLAGARDAFPAAFSTERKVLDRMVQGGDPRAAIRVVPKGVRGFFVNACQSALFNRVLAERLARLDRVEEGDLAWIHGKGAVFRVEDAAREQERCDRFEISPSGPVFGTKMLGPGGSPGALEARVLEEEGLTPASFDVNGVGRFEGERRPLRIPVGDPTFRLEGGDLLLAFSLPRGAYATNLLAEVMKTPMEGAIPPE